MGENPLLDGEAEYTKRTATMQGTQNCPPRPEPTVEFINNRHSGGGMGMSKSGGAKTSGAVTAEQSGAGAAQREAAELRPCGKRTREANQKETRRGRKGARGASSEPLGIKKGKNNNKKQPEKNRVEPGTDGSYLQGRHIKTLIGRPHNKQHANETV